jgi:RNA polymerase sigma-70 factor (ECF subfamily)
VSREFASCVDTGVSIPEALLVPRLRNGDLRAFDAVFAAHRASIFGYLLRMSRRRELAEELLQETFLRLARHAPRLRDDTNVRAWLFTVARNLWISHRRWAWLDGERLAELARGAVFGEPGPDALAEAAQAGRRVETALAKLPETYREVLLLVAVEKLTPQEAADVIGIRPDALRQRLARARAMMAQEVKDE